MPRNWTFRRTHNCGSGTTCNTRLSRGTATTTTSATMLETEECTPTTATKRRRCYGDRSSNRLSAQPGHIPLLAMRVSLPGQPECVARGRPHSLDAVLV